MPNALRAAALALLALSPFGCGISNRSHSDDAGGASGGKGGTTTTAGKGGTGGNGGSAGMAAAGTGADGGSGATGGAAGRAGDAGGSFAGMGVAGSPSDRCAVPAPMLFACDAGAPWYFHDGATNECIGVGPDKCDGGLGTHYSTLADCLADCAGAKPALTACDHAWDCTITEPGCCGGCDPVDPSLLGAVNSQRAGEDDDCAGIACGACVDVPESERNRQYVVPTCGGGKCGVMDLRQTSYTECTVNSDCWLRDGAGCCSDCDGQGYLSVSSTGFLDDLCAVVIPCPACMPKPPDDYEPYCDPDRGRCSLREALGAAGAAGAGGSP